MEINFKKVVALIMVLASVLAFTTFYVDAKEADYGCRESFEKFYKVNKPEGTSDFWMFYNEGYRYYREATDDETPEFIQVFAATEGGPDAMVTAIFGDYYIYTNWCEPYILGIYIYTPNDGNIYTLAEAVESGIEGIDVMFENNALSPVKANHICDVDKDSRLTIKDATFIQKAMVGLETMPDNVLAITDAGNCYPKEAYTNCLADLNRDGECDIKDVTAIQKSLAGLEY